MRARPWICISSIAACASLAAAASSFAGVSSCCVPNAGVGCDDPACQAAVCNQDQFCCDVAWDFSCADEALSLCVDLCDAPAPPNDECDAAIAIFAGVTPFSTFGATSSDLQLDDAACGEL